MNMLNPHELRIDLAARTGVEELDLLLGFLIFLAVW
jgi:hypothetical protein